MLNLGADLHLLGSQPNPVGLQLFGEQGQVAKDADDGLPDERLQLVASRSHLYIGTLDQAAGLRIWQNSLPWRTGDCARLSA